MPAGPARRGILIDILTQLDPNAKRPFDTVDKMLTAIEKRAGNIKIGFAAPSERGLGSVGSNGHSANGVDPRIQAEKNLARLRAEHRREEELRERDSSVRREAIIKRANDLVTADWKKQAKLAADAEIAELRRVQQERQKQLKQDVKTDSDYWKGFAKFGQQSKAGREKQEAADTKDRLAANQRATFYEKDQERIARQAKDAIAREREELTRAKEEAIGFADALTRTGEGLSYLGLIGERDIRKLADRLLAVKGIAESIRGGSQLLGFARGGLAGGAARAGIGIGGLAAAGGAAALGLGLQISSGGHGLAGSAIGFGQDLHSFGQSLAMIGMRPEEHAAFQRSRLTNLEDVNNPRGINFGHLVSGLPAAFMGDPTFRFGFAKDIDAAAANARNTERIRELNERRAGQRATARSVEGLTFGGDLHEIALQRELRDLQAEVTRERDRHRLRAGLGEAFFGTRDRFGRRGPGNTGIGQAGVFRPNTVFNDASFIRDPSQRFGYQQELLGRRVENEIERARIAQHIGANAEQAQAIRDKAGIIGTTENPNFGATGQAATELKQLERERIQLVKERGDLERKIGQQSVADAAKQLEYARQQLQVTKGEALGRRQELNRGLEAAGQMSPLQIQSIKEARRRFESNEPLAKEQIDVLLNAPDVTSQGYGRAAARRRAKENGADELFTQEQVRLAYAEGRESRDFKTFQQREGELRQGAAEVKLSGEANLLVEMRVDMANVEQVNEEQSAAVQRIRADVQAMIQAIRAEIHDATKQTQRNTNEQGSVNSR